MDPSLHQTNQNQNFSSGVPSSSRKRSRENETPSQRHKREKAAERQRRKRERDRQAGLNSILSLSQVHPLAPPPPPPESQLQLTDPQSISDYKSDDVSPDEAARRERVRAAARERQRKHRALVKQRKLRELGLDMGNEILPGMEEAVQYRVNTEYQPVMSHEIPSHPHPHQPHAMHEPPFPQGQPLGGQTFASTLLLSFSCAPLLKQHLLRTLQMTNEELASLEPIIAHAWDQWDQQRRMHYPHHSNGPKPPDGSALSDGSVPNYSAMNEQNMNHPYVHDPSQAPVDFRARFQRSLVAPSPFQSTPASATLSPSASSSAPANSATTSDTLDPNISLHSEDHRPPLSGDVTNGLDPQLGQARDEAAGVAGKLER